jgi:hypothetical protein
MISISSFVNGASTTEIRGGPRESSENRPMIRFSPVVVVLAQTLLGVSAVAHELRPAYLSMEETAPNAFFVLWKVPALGQMRLGLDVRLPESCAATAQRSRSIDNMAYSERSQIVCSNGL